MLPSNATPEQMQKHFAKIFGSGNAPFFSTCATVTTKAPTVDWDNFSRNFTGPAIYVPAEKGNFASIVLYLVVSRAVVPNLFISVDQKILTKIFANRITKNCD